jgi:formyl-CoA transferase
MAGALDGIRVLDLSRILAGPYCTMTLGDLGAEVIKVELPGTGDDTRAWGPPFAGSESAYFLAVNRNKKGITVNLKTAAGRDLVRDLARRADILVENFKVGTLDRLGLGYDDLRADNPRLIYCSITAFGRSGPYRDLPGYDYTIQALGGLMSITGHQDGEPTKVGVAIVDITAGLFATTAILAAIHARAITGAGQRVEVSLLQAQLAWLANVGANYLVGGQVPGRYGNAHPNIVPYQSFDCADRPIVIAVGNDGQWRAFCAAIDRTDLAMDPRFATNPDRVRNRDDLMPILGGVLRARSADEWFERLRASDVPCAPINSLDRTFGDPQVEALGVVLEVDHPDAGRVPLVRWPFELAETPATLRLPPPTLGADTDSVLRDVLGLSATDIAALRERGAI